MQNVQPAQIRTSMVMLLEEFSEAVNTVYPHTLIHADLDGLWYERDVGFPEFEEEDLRIALAQYYGVSEITSIHIDDCELIGVWVTFKE